MQHLAFQLFTASPGFDTEGGVTRTIQATQPYLKLVERRTADIVQAIGVTGEDERALAINIGPLCFDHTDEQLHQIIDLGFDLARHHDIAVGFHIDDSKFVFRRSDLWNQPECLETSDWNGTLNTGQYLNWGEEWKLAPQLCFNAEPVIAAARVLASTIGHRIAAKLDTMDNPERNFAGVIAGWETSINDDYATGRKLGYRALGNRGFAQDDPPDDIASEIEIVVREWIDVWAAALHETGITMSRIYSHVVPGTVVPFETSMIEHGLPGFTMYNGTEAQAEVFRALEESGHTGGWALAEGADVNIEAPIWRPGTDPEAYLNELFSHGASLVNLFGWGVGPPQNPFRRAVESPEAIAAYKRWLDRWAVTDLVARLREDDWWRGAHGSKQLLCMEAADEIERLRRERGEQDKGIVASSRLLADYGVEIERLQNDLKEADAAIRELQQDACNRAGVPMPSQRSVVDRQQGEIERLRMALTWIATNPIDGANHRSVVAEYIDAARAALSKPEDRA